MEKREKLNFSTNAKLGKLVGRELITNNIIAVFELIKNSYDAFADEVCIEFVNFSTSGKDDEISNRNKRNMVVSDAGSKIVISDNGCGMSFAEIKENWMEIGTTSKEGVIERQSVRGTQTIRRIMNGEKGIGRFGCDKLGAKLKMVSTGAKGYETSTVAIDWNLFEDHKKKLQDIEIDCIVERNQTIKRTGVVLEISELRNLWTNMDIIVNDSFEYATTGISADLSDSRLLTYTISDEGFETNNPALKDATNRQGLNEDAAEFLQLKEFIWKIMELLQGYIFSRLKSDAEKQGKIIEFTVDDIKKDLSVFRNEIPQIYDEISLPEEQKKLVVDKTLKSFHAIEKNIEQVEKANRQWSKRLIVMEKIVGTETMLYDLLHAVKNKLDALNALIDLLELEARKNQLSFNTATSKSVVNEISRMVVAALKRTAPVRRKKENIILAHVLNSFIEEKSLVYPDISITLKNIMYNRVSCNVDGLRTVLDNLMNNSIGLASCLQYMKEQEGDISYVKNGSLGGALFVLSFPVR